jgi:hypothetical protein
LTSNIKYNNLLIFSLEKIIIFKLNLNY